MDLLFAFPTTVPLYPFLRNFYWRFINLSYGSPCPRLELSEKCFFDLNNLFHFCPFKQTHLPAFLLALCNTMSVVCVRSLSESFNFVTWILWFFLYYLSFLPFFSLSQNKIGYHYESVLVFRNIRSILEAILQHCSVAWAKEQFFKGISWMKTLSIINAICTTTWLHPSSHSLMKTIIFLI